jgi:hypothetical protein
MPKYDKDGNIEKWCWYDIFWDVEKKKFFPPRWWVKHLAEQSEDDWELPWFIQSKIYWLNDYLDWLKQPRGVTSTIEPIKKKYIIKSLYDSDYFDYDGAGDCYTVEEKYDVHDSLDDILKSLKKNIRYENSMKPKLDTVEEYCQEFGFEVYERLY